jgi:hypothetical protein
MNPVGMGYLLNKGIIYNLICGTIGQTQCDQKIKMNDKNQMSDFEEYETIFLTFMIIIP